MAKLWQFSQGHPKPAFSEKVQRGDQGKFFKNRPKSSPRLNGLRALWRKWHYPPISMHLYCKDWRRLWRKQWLQTVPEWPSHWYFRKVTQNPYFLKKCKGGTRGNFSKIAQKVAFVWKSSPCCKNRPKSSFRLKGPKALWRKWHYPPISMHLKCKDRKRVWRKKRLQTVPEWPS